MNYRPLLLISFIAATSLIIGCADDNDDRFASDVTIKNFVYRGMNAFYLYKAEIPVLADDRFETVNELEEYHKQFDSPEEFFNSLKFDRDKFSIIYDDYIALEQVLSGQSPSNGMEFVLVEYPDNDANVFGFVRYTQNNSSAAENGVERGMIFNRIDGIQLTRSNFRTLLNQSTYTLGLATLEDDEIEDIDQEIPLFKEPFQEDPIHISKVIEEDGRKVGYLFYSSFLRQFDEDLNDVFGDFKSQGITDLVLDLRYNGGGSVNTAIILGSLISGNPTSDLFTREEWNPDIQEFLEANNPDQLLNFFKDRTDDGSALNELGLSEVYIITTPSTASASELVINSLAPYINVIQVGDNTAGKFQASITVYDSEDFRRAGANPAHTYAMQPLVYRSVNSAGNTDYFDGLEPDIELVEEIDNLGTLGDPNERLLRACLDDIIDGSVISSFPTRPRILFNKVSSSNDLKLLGNDMWNENLSLPIE
ncbi:S41 family peptidase [Nonlabens ponticola]|uniref:Peptidase S41 n=1 Tax=Nonlabens ponticola TaxID=2496866 RepID=A0A3S9MYG0_9FLAO|nr:S41 family peptidase [Nonlabens ponticola]AZQ44154.1 peptidase S41 [Nonlabens ponticola]